MARKTILPNGKLDIHHFGDRLRNGETHLLRDDSITDNNKRLILDFLRDCELGKTVLKSQKKQISKGRIVKYLGHLKPLSRWFGKDFDSVEMKDMEDLILKLEKRATHKGKRKTVRRIRQARLQNNPPEIL